MNLVGNILTGMSDNTFSINTKMINYLLRRRATNFRYLTSHYNGLTVLNTIRRARTSDSVNRMHYLTVVTLSNTKDNVTMI